MEIEEIIGEWECVIIQWKRRESEMRHRWEWVIDWLNECTNKFPWKVIDSMEFDVTCWKKREEKGKKTREKGRWGKMLKFPWKGYEWKGKRRGWNWIGGQGIWFPWKVIDSMEFDVTCWKKREEKGKKTREKGRWGKMLKFPWKGYEWKGKRRGWTWIGGQGIWFPWNCLYWRMFDGIRLHMKVYGITWMNVLIPVKLSPWLRGKGDRVGHLPIKRFIPVTGQWTVSMGINCLHA